MIAKSYVRFLMMAPLLVVSVAGCVSSSVTSKVLQSTPEPIDHIVLVVKTGKFSGFDMAASLGQKNLDSIAPHLIERLPVIFSLNNVQMKHESQVGGDSIYLLNKKTLTIVPVSARYSSSAGQQLTLRADLFDFKTSKYLWTADIYMGTPGFGQFDAKLANSIGVKLLERLRADRLIPIPNKEIKTE